MHPLQRLDHVVEFLAGPAADRDDPLQMTDYSFQVTRNPPGLGEHGADVLENWLVAG